MLKKVVAALLILCGSSFAQTTNTGVTTTYQIGDDGYAAVPLPFKFPLFGQSFSNSWMYDNGIISFVNPSSANAVSPWQWSAPAALGQGTGQYFIAALWADIAPTANTVYSTTSDGTYMKYTWSNIAEYYSQWGTPRLNSFSATITPDGTVTTSYYSLNLQTSNVAAGVVGDPAKGEVYQQYAAPFGTVITNGSINNWTYKPYDPCLDNPLYSATCPGFSDALAKLTATTSPTQSTSTATTTTPTTTVTTTVVDDPINPTVTVTSTTTTTSTSPVTNTVSPTTGTVNVAPTVISPTTVTSSTQKSSASSSTGTSLGLSVVAKNQQREQSIVGLAVQNALSGAESAAMASQQESLSVASSAVSNSIGSVSAMTQTQVGTGIKITPVNVGALSNTQSSDSLSTTDSGAMKYSNALTDRTNPLNEYIESKTAIQNNTTLTTGSVVNRNAGNNEVAGTVDITRMALAPAGYADYMNLTLRDVAFYAPKEVYNNQKTIDNAKALRQLTNDSRHREMVELQYNKN